jgi:predicted acylesterase/phospholipase RssA
MGKFGLVLSGGGARGFAHLGVIKALEEVDIIPSIISGTSAGAIVAAFYAAGYNPEEIIEIALQGNFFSFSNLLLNKSGLFNMQSFERIYKAHFKQNLIEKLPIPICITATDIIKGKPKYFTSGSISKALLASSCLPMVFEPIKYNDTLYLDGGILNNLPVPDGCIQVFFPFLIRAICLKFLVSRPKLNRPLFNFIFKELMLSAVIIFSKAISCSCNGLLTFFSCVKDKLT